MLKSFEQAECWQHISTSYSSNDTQIQILKMYHLQQSIMASQIFAFKIITISPPTKIISSKSIQKISLKSKDLSQVKTEIAALQRLRGFPCIIELYEVLIEDGDKGNSDFFKSFLRKSIKNGRSIALVIEYCPYKTLKDYLTQQEILQEKEIVELSIKIFETLKILNECSILHRDLRSVNLMMMPEGMKLIDFDCSFIKGYSNNANLTFAYVQHTTAPQVVTLINANEEYKDRLTPQRLYQSQEKCDLYSFGIIIYEMIAKEQYRVGSNLEEKLNKSHISQDLIRFVQSLLKEEPNQRLNHVQTEDRLIILSEKYGLSIAATARRKLTKLSIPLPCIEKDPSNSSKSISNSVTLSDWSLESFSTKQVSNTSKNLQRSTTISQYLSNHRTLYS